MDPYPVRTMADIGMGGMAHMKGMKMDGMPSDQMPGMQRSNAYVFVGPFALHARQHSDADCHTHFRGNRSSREMCGFGLHSGLWPRGIYRMLCREVL